MSKYRLGGFIKCSNEHVRRTSGETAQEVITGSLHVLIGVIDWSMKDQSLRFGEAQYTSCDRHVIMPMALVKTCSNLFECFYYLSE